MVKKSDELSAVVYLADGIECRCMLLALGSTVGRVIDRMFAVQSDWDSLSGSGGSGGGGGGDSGSSSTDDPRERYGIVLVEAKPGSDVMTERVLSNSTRIDSEELLSLRREWAKVALRHLQARFARKAGKLAEPAAGSLRAKPQAKKAPRRRDPAREYWFIAAGGGGGVKQAGDGPNAARIKFVNLDEYNVVKAKKGWLPVKDKSAKKGTDRWVVVEENTLSYYAGPDDVAARQPLGWISDLAAAKIESKSKKGIYTITLSEKKVKISIVCENDVMFDRWDSALRRGKSGKANAAAERMGPTIKLKPVVEVEPIPEYTEEEELRDEARATATGRAGAATGEYLSLGQMAALASGHASGDGYLTTEMLGRAVVEDSYMSVGEMDTMLMNSNGEYLTFDAVQGLLNDAGYGGVDGGSGYLTLDVAVKLVGELHQSGVAPTAAELARRAAAEGQYLSMVDVHKLAKSSGGDDTYITLDEAGRLASGLVAGSGDYLTLDEVAAQLKGPDVDAAYLSLGEVQAQLSAALADRKGEYLTVDRMQELCREAGYLSIAEMRELGGADPDGDFE